MNIIPLPVKTEIAVNFKHTFRYDSQLAKDFREDFEDDVPFTVLHYGYGGIREMVIYATEEAKHERHYTDEQMDYFAKNPLALIEEWGRYDGYTHDFSEEIVFHTLSDRDFIVNCVSYVEKHGLNGEFTREKYDECKRKIAIMLKDLAKITAANYARMLHDDEAIADELEGFVAFGFKKGQNVKVYFYDYSARKTFDYINAEYIRNIFYNKPLSGCFDMILGDETEWSAFLMDYIEDNYQEWNGEVKEDIIAKICNDIEKDSGQELPYSESDRVQLAEMARKWLEENLGETLDVD